MYSNTIFLALNDPKFLSDWRGKEEPMVSLTGYFSFWGYFFIIFTLYILFCVDEDRSPISSTKDKDSSESSDSSEEKDPLLSNTPESYLSSDLSKIKDESELSVWQTYHLYWDILKNPYVLLFNYLYSSSSN